LRRRLRDQPHRLRRLLSGEPDTWHDSISSRIGVPTKPGILLYLSSGRDGRVRGGEPAEQVACDVALERSHDLFRGAAFSAAPYDVRAGGGIDAHSHDGDRGERPNPHA